MHGFDQHLETLFDTKVLGVTVTVERIDMSDDEQIIAICRRGRSLRAIPILDLVFSDDHCPAHVHARHRGEGWIARVKFSYVNDAVKFMSIAPAKDIPLQRVVNRLLSDIRSACRIVDGVGG